MHTVFRFLISLKYTLNISVNDSVSTANYNDNRIIFKFTSSTFFLAPHLVSKLSLYGRSIYFSYSGFLAC